MIPLGIVISLIFTQSRLKGASVQKQARATILMCWGAFACAIVFMFWTAIVEGGDVKTKPWDYAGVLMVFLILFGFCIGYPYYIPPAVFALTLGGDHTATL